MLLIKKNIDQLNLSQAEFKRDFDLQEINWFYRGMSRVWLSFIEASLKNANLLDYALDLGCGVGGKIPYLQNFSRMVFGMDLSIDALMFCNRKFFAGLTQATGEYLPYKDETFSLVNVFDVLEHIEDDKKALRKINSIMANKGLLIITVPAFKFLWSQHDIANFHKRRYELYELKEKLEEAGFKIKRITYCNFPLFPFIAVYRVIQYRLLRPFIKVRRTRCEDLPSILNLLLGIIFKLESLLIKRMNFPFGVSILCIAQKVKKD